MSALTTPAYHLAGARQRSMAGAGPKPAGQALEWRLDLSETDQYGLCAKPLPQMPYTHSFAQAGAYPDLPDALLSQRTGMPFAKTENRERKNRRNQDFRAEAALRTNPGTRASTGVSAENNKASAGWLLESGGAGFTTELLAIGANEYICGKMRLLLDGVSLPPLLHSLLPFPPLFTEREHQEK